MTETPSIAEALERGARVLAAANVPRARFEARLLLGRAAGVSAETMIAHPERMLEAEQALRYSEFLTRRARREPVSQILGQREFWSLAFKVSRDTLTPRPESETLIESALAFARSCAGPLRVLDLGTGTGCLLLALLSELAEAEGVGIDRSLEACRVARENAEALGLGCRARFLVGDWGGAVSARFDLILANPPYIPEGEIEALEPEVARFEPRSALAGGSDGLDAYRALAGTLYRLLAPGGRAFLELGQGQADAVARILNEVGLYEAGRSLDLAGIERCLIMSASPLANP